MGNPILNTLLPLGVIVLFVVFSYALVIVITRYILLQFKSKSKIYWLTIPVLLFWIFVNLFLYFDKLDSQQKIYLIELLDIGYYSLIISFILYPFALIFSLIISKIGFMKLRPQFVILIILLFLLSFPKKSGEYAFFGKNMRCNCIGQRLILKGIDVSTEFCIGIPHSCTIQMSTYLK